jgi:peptide-methionine (S)-S-oxide reductase
MAFATFAAGCFWGVEASFQKIPGVIGTRVGYTGGTVENPTYEQVCRHNTGHAEAVQVEYDPSQITYEELLTAFWNCHTPTSYHRQGPDVGSQYRSAIFYHDETQHQLALQSKNQLDHSGRYDSPIVTDIVALDVFWPAEEYHQNYFKKHGMGSCDV